MGTVQGCESAVETRFLVKKSCLKVLLSRKLFQSSERPPLEELVGIRDRCGRMCVVLGLNFFSFPGESFLFVLVYQNLKIYRVVRNGEEGGKTFDIILVKNLF